MRSVQSGITTDVLKRSAPAALAGRCLSLRCDGRSLDLCLETEPARDAWQQLLQVLVAKEAEGRLPELLGGEIGRLADTEKPLEALLLYESVGKFVVSPANLEALGTSAR